MKARRESGASFVSPTTTDVRTGSALMMDFLRSNLGGAFSKRSQRNANHQPARIQPRDVGDKKEHKKQGRRRSITLTALPAPDIEIGLRRPVSRKMTRIRAGECDPFHNLHEKVATGRLLHIAAGQPGGLARL